MLIEILLKSSMQCECENKTPLLYILYTVYLPALTNANIMISDGPMPNFITIPVRVPIPIQAMNS